MKSPRTRNKLEIELGNLSNNIPGIFCIIDPKSDRILHMNSPGMRLFGYKQDDLDSLLYSDLYSPKSVSEMKLVMQDVLDGLKDVCSIPLRTKDGSSIPVETRFTKGKFNNADVIISISHDKSVEGKVSISQREIAHEAAILSNFINHNPIAILITDKQGFHLNHNKAFEKLWGIKPEPHYSFLNDPVLQQLDWFPKIKKLLQGQAISIPELCYNNKKIRKKTMEMEGGDQNLPVYDNIDQFTDKDIWIRAEIFPIMDDNGEVSKIVVLQDDITQRKLDEAELNEYHTQLEGMAEDQMVALTNKKLEVQYSSVISMISSIFIHDVSKLDVNIKNGLKTLGNSLKCDCVVLFKHKNDDSSPNSSDLNFTPKWQWTSNQVELELNGLDALFQDAYYSKYAEKLPLTVYHVLNSDVLSEPTLAKLLPWNMSSLVFLPVVSGQDNKRFGTLVIGRRAGVSEFTARDIHLALQVSIIISLGINNQNVQEMLVHGFKALEKLDVAIFIVQGVGVGPKVKFVNQTFCNLVGKTEQEIYLSKTHLDFFNQEDSDSLGKLYMARKSNPDIPRTYKINVITPEGLKCMQMSFTLVDVFGNRTLFGILLNLDQQNNLKTPKMILDRTKPPVHDHS